MVMYVHLYRDKMGGAGEGHSHTFPEAVFCTELSSLKMLRARLYFLTYCLLRDSMNWNICIFLFTLTPKSESYKNNMFSD